MSHPSQALAASFEDLDDAVGDFRNGANAATDKNLFLRFAFLLEQQPIADFLTNVCKEVDYKNWRARAEATTETLGPGELEWPLEIRDRVSIQLTLFQEMASGREDVFSFIAGFYDPIGDHVGYWDFATNTLGTFVRDLKKLSVRNPLSVVFSDALDSRQRTGDAELDRLLESAQRLARDAAPEARRQGLETLWDAWERLKSLDGPNKKMAITKRLEYSAGNSGPFLTMLEVEAGELTRIGNEFHIRHFESNRHELSEPKHCEYFFFRLFSMIQLLLAKPNHE